MGSHSSFDAFGLLVAGTSTLSAVTRVRLFIPIIELGPPAATWYEDTKCFRAHHIGRAGTSLNKN